MYYKGIGDIGRYLWLVSTNLDLYQLIPYLLKR